MSSCSSSSTASEFSCSWGWGSSPKSSSVFTTESIKSLLEDSTVMSSSILGTLISSGRTFSSPNSSVVPAKSSGVISDVSIVGSSMSDSVSSIVGSSSPMAVSSNSGSALSSTAGSETASSVENSALLKMFVSSFPLKAMVSSPSSSPLKKPVFSSFSTSVFAAGIEAFSAARVGRSFSSAKSVLRFLISSLRLESSPMIWLRISWPFALISKPPSLAALSPPV